ncbi:MULTISPECIES: hypothetical protein [Aeromonas]|uniref:hypothetical protein n=1 Tax=Aeromonas TaxID=642 RepID=UPI00131579D2|nr:MULTISPECIES: hypothetical protein [Aeromonas]MDX7771064.1 hypothetical protein [Aeromonas caviae]MDX7846818.1 hypothetical protein [Aeromonas caviae]QQM74592.1 hypothetical protein JH254_13880 [Aeromonas caviae]QQV19486.1 hypothetical protein JJJ22_20545 [Aeromonas caviae]UTI03374.1 hypothetical protein NJR02_04010 [Aeromonas caviae]
MSHANHAPLVNRSKLEAEIQCGSHAGVCHDQVHTAFLYSRNDCAKKRGQANTISFRGWQVTNLFKMLFVNP